MRQVDGQKYCAVCGHSPGGANHSRVFLVEGAKVRLTYPAGIEYHDIIPRGNGGDAEDLDNQVPLCTQCHTWHHSAPYGRLIFCGSAWSRADGRTGLLVLGDREGLDTP